MSKYRIEFSPAARRHLKKLDKQTRKKIVAKAEALADNPRPIGFKKLEAGYDLYPGPRR
ncbi:MAG: type II toxin-antitoxin system RelE/ParE family toxin [Pyrinomonadaceae bacterium]